VVGNRAIWPKTTMNVREARNGCTKNQSGPKTVCLYTSLIVAVSFMGGLQLTVLGIVGEYLGAVFDEVKRRPLYIIDEVFGRDDR
jgi:hypothetical protein